MKKLKPAHPGKLLLEQFIRPMHLTVYRVAKDACIPQSSLAAIVSSQRSISAETAMRLGRYSASTLNSGLTFRRATT